MRSILVPLIALLLITTQRLPAPIQEVPQETPTPAAKQTTKAKSKPSAKPETESSGSENSTKRQAGSAKQQNKAAQNRTPFAGTWLAKTGFSAGVTLIVSPAQDSAVVKGLSFWGDRPPQSRNGQVCSSVVLLALLCYHFHAFFRN